MTTSYYLGSKLIAVRKGATLSYVMQDHLGSTVGTLDASGNQVNTTVYSEFGSVSYAAGTLPTDKKFTGQRLDGTGLYYYGARYYDPAIGRFISPDTIVPHPFNPQSLNRYSYCLNSPLKYVDPTGHDPYMDRIYGIEHGTNPEPSSPPGSRKHRGDKDRTGSNNNSTSPMLPLESKPTDPYDNDIWGVAIAGSLVILADDVTGIGVVDDLVIPLLWAGCAMVWVEANKDALTVTVTDTWDSITVFLVNM